jgi:cell wall-associated NlpC family hydrolase
MNSPFFDNVEARERLKAIGVECEGTPWRKYGRFPGRGGGFDCIGFPEYVYAKVGLVRPGDFEFARADADYSSASTMRRIIRYLRGQGKLPDGSVDPQSARLAEIFAPVPIFRGLRAHHDQRPKVGERFRRAGDAVNVDASLFMLGDLIALRKKGQFHFGIMLEGRQFISAIPFHGVRGSNVHDTFFSFYIAALFRPLRPNAETLTTETRK